MNTIAIKEAIGQLPMAELEASMKAFLEPMIKMMPDRRLGRVAPLAVQGILGSVSPVVLQMAQAVSRFESGVWPDSSSGTFTWKYTVSFQTLDDNADITVFWDNTVSPDGGSASAGLWTATVVPIPEPSGVALLGLGLSSLMLRRGRK